MIASLHGTLESMGLDWAVINVNGVGYKVHMPASTLSQIAMSGGRVHVFTHMAVREDDISLYGFGSGEELGLFQMLTSVSGVGPRIAMSVLSTLKAEEITMALATENADLLTTVPGIGKKTANRLVLELKDKIGTTMIATPSETGSGNADVISALTSLGYSLVEATRAVAALPASPDLTLEEKITLALQSFGGK